MDQNEDAELSRQIVKLMTQRKRLRQKMKEEGSGRSADPSPSAGQLGKKTLSKVIADVQIVPPRATQNEFSERSGKMNDTNQSKDGEWQQATRKGAKKKKRRKGDATRAAVNSGKRQAPDSGRTTANKGKGTPKVTSGERSRSQGRRRLPRTAAVAIKGMTDNFSYAAALKNLREKIALPELKIKNTHIRKAAGGGLIIEIPGEVKAKKADTLRDKIEEVLGATAKVSRPLVKGELRLIGLDDSVVAEEVIAVAGGCDMKEVKVGMIREMTK